jgi:hypothetical protein
MHIPAASGRSASIPRLMESQHLVCVGHAEMDFLGVSPISWRPGSDLQLVNPMQLNRMIATYLAAPRRLKESWLHKGWLSETILKLQSSSADSHDEPSGGHIRPAFGIDRWTQK